MKFLMLLITVSGLAQVRPLDSEWLNFQSTEKLWKQADDALRQRAQGGCVDEVEIDRVKTLSDAAFESYSNYNARWRARVDAFLEDQRRLKVQREREMAQLSQSVEKDTKAAAELRQRIVALSGPDAASTRDGLMELLNQRERTAREWREAQRKIEQTEGEYETLITKQEVVRSDVVAELDGIPDEREFYAYAYERLKTVNRERCGGGARR